MAKQTYYLSFAVTLPANGNIEVQALTKLQNQKQVIERIYSDSVANVNVVVYKDQIQVMNLDSQHFPSNGEGLPLTIDMTDVGVVNVGMVNNTGAAHTQNITIQFTRDPG